jgi:hypothetical protein
LKGKAVTGVIKVKRGSGTPRVIAGERIIAFVDDENRFDWAGRADSLECDLIMLAGFYDYNAYWVFPDAVTMAQLKQYLNEKKFDGEGEGSLQFFSYEKQIWETTGTSVHFTYTYFNDDSVSHRLEVKGLPLIDFKPEPEFGFYGSGIGLEFEPNMVRPLTLNGFIDSALADGHHFTAHFEVKEPENITKEMFYEYLAHPEYGPLWFEKEITLASGEKYTLAEGQEMGRIGYLIYGKDTIDCPAGGNPSTEDSSYYLFGNYYDPFIKVELYPLPKDDPRFREFRGGTWSDIYALRMTNYVGRFYVKENGVLVDKGPCTLSLKAAHFTRNLNYR